MRGVHSLIASRDGVDVKLEWVADSDFRFFPIMRHSVFGYVLHPVDLALNKVMAAAGRREVRDVVDLVTIDRNILPLGAAIWAAVEKSPGFTPEGLIDEIRRNAQHSKDEWNALASEPAVDADETMKALRAALERADAFVRRMPSDVAGHLFLDASGKVVEPAPERLHEYAKHAGARRGHWPENEDLTTAMLRALGNN